MRKGKRTPVTKFPPRIKYFFEQFCNAANKALLHPFDDIRFNAFITACHIGKSKLNSWDVARLLENEGFDNDHAESLGQRYRDGRELLKKNYNSAVLWWKEPEISARYLYRPDTNRSKSKTPKKTIPPLQTPSSRK